MIDHNAMYRRSQDVVCRQVGDESILVPVSHDVAQLDSVFTLSPTAARVWDLLERGHQVAELADLLCAEYDVDRPTAMAEVAELLEALRDARLVTETA